MSLITANLNYLGANIIETDKISTSKLNYIIPFYSLFVGKTIIKGEDKILVYSSPDTDEELDTHSNIIKKYGQAVNHMVNSKKLKILKTTRNPNSYILTKGFLGFKDEKFNVIPLIVLCIKSKDIFDLKKENLDKTKFSVIINNKVFEEQHVLMFKNMKKCYVDVLIQEGIDVIYTNDVDKWIYNSIDYIPKFNSITEMQEHLSTISELALDLKLEDEERKTKPEIINDTLELSS